MFTEQMTTIHLANWSCKNNKHAKSNNKSVQINITRHLI